MCGPGLSATGSGWRFDSAELAKVADSAAWAPYGRLVSAFPPDDLLVDRIAAALRAEGQFEAHVDGGSVDEIARIR